MLKQRLTLVDIERKFTISNFFCEGLLIGRKLSTFESTRSPEVNDFRWSVKVSTPFSSYFLDLLNVQISNHFGCLEGVRLRYCKTQANKTL